MKVKRTFRTHHIEPEHQGLTVEEYLKKKLQLSGRKIQKITRLKGILLNNKPVYLQKKLKAGQMLNVLELSDQSYGVDPEPGVIDILYEDSRIIILDKPGGLLVHPAGRTRHGTLANYLAAYFAQNGKVCTIRPLHRLDRDTTGCVAFAKDSLTQTILEKQLLKGSFKRSYLAIVQGVLEPLEGTIDAPIGSHPFKPNRRAINEQGEKALTHYRTVLTSQGMSLLTLTLETGRTHQIRVHLASVGHPVIGDKIYGKSSPLIRRQALHAQSLEFLHPEDGRKIKVQAPFPADFAFFNIPGCDF
ncbi:MAG: RluA family pseudouridine synthase [Peptococcaceae bacterium]|nr:RluA family pseudouridine synthase [Peptococcaceae bacterium]